MTDRYACGCEVNYHGGDAAPMACPVHGQTMCRSRSGEPDAADLPALEDDLLGRLRSARADYYKLDVSLSLNGVELDLLIAALAAARRDGQPEATKDAADLPAHQHKWETVGTDALDGKSDLNWCDECGALMGMDDEIVLPAASRRAGGG